MKKIFLTLSLVSVTAHADFSLTRGIVTGVSTGLATGIPAGFVATFTPSYPAYSVNPYQQHYNGWGQPQNPYSVQHSRYVGHYNPYLIQPTPQIWFVK